MSKISHENDVAFIKALAALLNEQELTELEVSRAYGTNDNLTVRVSRAKTVVTQVAAPVPAPAAAAPQAAAPLQPAPQAAPSSDPAAHPGAVTSPMVGTVFLSPEPGTDPFITIGAEVKLGQTLVIIEAMKTMNHIPAPRAGIVRRILVDDGSPVEYGAPLVIVE